MKRQRAILTGAFVVLAVLLVFSPALRNGFVDWDDDILIYANPYIRGLDLHHLRWMATSTLNSAWQPLGWLLFALIDAVCGMKAWAFHLESLKLHAVATALVFALGYELFSGELAAAALAALLFAVHPLQVESVAWASCLADVLSCVFVLGAVLAHLKSWKKTSWALAVLAALSRWEAVTLFPVLLIVDALIMKRKTSWRDKIPFLLVAMGAGAANAIAKAQVMHYDGVPHSPAVAALTAAELFGHVLIPARLRPVYFITPGYAPFGFSGPEAAACLIGATALAFLFRKKYPAALAAWLCALAVIAPVVSLSRPGPVFVHDRYAYLLLAVLALAFGGLMKRRAHLKQAAAILVVLLAAGSINRIQVWHDPETLWKSVVATDPQESLSYFNLGDYLLRQGKPYQAIYYLREQARRNPEKGRMNLAHAWNDLGAAYAELGRWEQAERSFTNALVFAPGERQIRANLLAARARLRKKA